MNDHKYVHLSTHYKTENAGYETQYIRLDIFFDEITCEIKEVVKSEYSRDIPLWWKH